MTARVAKISLGLDLKPLQADSSKAKKMMADALTIKVDPRVKSELMAIFGKDLQKAIGDTKKQISELNEMLRQLGRVSATSFNPRTVNNYTAALGNARNLLRSLRGEASGAPGMMPSTGGGGGGGSVPPSGGGAAPTPPAAPRHHRAGRRAGGVMSQMQSSAAMLGIGLGVSSALGRSEQLGGQGLQVRELTGGNTVGGTSSQGFTQSDRLGRGASIARGVGRDMTGQDLSNRVDQSEKLQRAYGISGEEYAGATGSARKAGAKDQSSFIAGTIGDAVAMKLSGSSVGEYLAAMSGYLGSISKGVDVKTQSLRGFASAIGSLDFFKKDPERIFDAISKLDNVLKGGGDEFQQLSAYRAIQSTGGGQMTPAGVNVRQSVGTFGGAGLSEKAHSAGMDDLAGVFKLSGEDIMDKFLADAFKTATNGGKMGKGGKKGKMDNAAALQIFQETTNLKDQQGAEIFFEMAARQKAGKGATLSKGSKQAFSKGMQTTEDRSKTTMDNFDGAVTLFSQRIDNLKNVISMGITDGLMTTVKKLDSFADATGMFKSDVEKFGAAIAAMALGKGALSGLGGEIMGGAVGGAAGAAVAGAASTAMGFLGTGTAVVGAAAAGYLFGDAVRDELNKWTKGEWDESVGKFWNKISKALGMGGEDTGNMDLQDSIKKYGSGGDEAYADYKQKADDAGADMGPGDYANMISKEKDEKDKRKGRLNVKLYRQTMIDQRVQDEADITDIADRSQAGERDQKDLKYLMDNPDKVAAAPENRARGGRIGFADGGYGTESGKKANAAAIAAEFNKRKSGASDSGSGGGIIDWIKDQLDDKNGMKAGIARATHAGGGGVGHNTQMGYRSGGSAIGTDKIDAKLTQGEFVVNARDASSNMMALVHANSGGRIVAASTGGLMPTLFGAGGEVGDLLSSLPSSIGLDSGDMQSALGGNTRALMMLASAMATGGSVAPMRQMPRGQAGLRYG